MIKHTLPCGRYVLVDKCDEHLLRQHKWTSMVNSKRNTIYAQASGGVGVTLLLHRMIHPDAEVVDHRNGNGLNNCRFNLRPCTREENSWNRGPTTGRKYKGVFKQERKRKRDGGITVRWVVMLEAWGVRHSGGSHDTEEAAARAWDVLARKHHGEFAYLNFPDEGAIYDFQATRAVASIQPELYSRGL